MRIFTEIQRLPVWVYIIMAPSFVVTIFLLTNSYIDAAPGPKRDEMLIIFLIVILIEVLAVFLIASMKQITRVDVSGIYYKYPPFKRKEVHIPTLNITHYDLVAYTTPYYGYRTGFWNALRKKPSITMIGISKAVRFTFRDGKTLLIGTKKPDELMRTLDYITKKHEEHEDY